MSKSYYFEVEVGPGAETFESYMKKVFARIGLTTDSSIKSYEKFIGQSFFRDMVNNAKSNRDVAEAVRNSKGKIIKISVHVFPRVVDNLRRFGINLSVNTKGKATFTGYASKFSNNVKKYQNFTPAPETPISQWTTVQKLDSVIRRAALLLPEDVGKQLLVLVEPWALALMAAVLLAWVVGHFFGISEIADILLILGGLALGAAAYQAGGQLYSFAVKCINGRTEKDLDESAHHLSEAVALVGVQLVMALLLAKAPKVFQDRAGIKLNQLPKVERPVGEWFYKPKIRTTDNLRPGVLGETSVYGDIEYSSSLVGKLINETILHEKVHRFLTPKLYPLRNLRIVMTINGYAKSFLLRYLEEALAETVAQVGTYGLKNVLIGIKFPVKEGYVTLASMGTEAGGIFLGPINAGGMSYRVYFSPKVENDGKTQSK